MGIYLDEDIRAALTLVTKIKIDIRAESDFAEELEYYEPIIEQLNEACDALRGAIALT